jgi:hypothetical protein
LRGLQGNRHYADAAIAAREAGALKFNSAFGRAVDITGLATASAWPPMAVADIFT